MSYFDILDLIGDIQNSIKVKLIQELSSNAVLRGKIDYRFKKLKPKESPIEAFEEIIPLKPIMGEMQYQDLLGVICD